MTNAMRNNRSERPDHMEAGMSKACVIGWPIEHSRSPMIHNYWIAEHGLNARYDKRAVRPEELRDFLLGLERLGLRGCNVTIPHKEEAFRIVARANPSGIAPMAARLQAANTIWLENGKPCADNTDVHGFMENFRQSCPHWRARGQSVTIIGAGGAARAIVAGFADAGVKRITLVNRTVKKAEQIAARMDGPIHPQGLDSLPAALPETDVLVNATSLGMSGQPPLKLDVPALPAHAIVADIVYAPLRTQLLRQAEERGLGVVEGLGMLLHQAAPGFEKWFGVRPRVTEALRRLVEEDIRRSC